MSSPRRARPPIRDFLSRGWLFDMDGVLYRGKRPIPGAIRFLGEVQRRGIPYLLLTNHGCLTPLELSRKLARMGIRVPPARIYTSAEATAEWLAARGVRAVFALGEAGLRSALRRQEIRCARTRVRHVVVSLDRAMTYAKLRAACGWIARGARLIGTNPDPSYPVEDGQAPECGALLAAIESATGQKAIIIGKPSPAIFRQAAKRLGLPVHRLTMIGDRLDTDILGAKRAGARAILVLTGHSTRSMLRGAAARPDRVVEGLEELALAFRLEFGSK